MNRVNRPKQPQALPSLSEAIQSKPMENIFGLLKKLKNNPSLEKN
jgi:hypothetical protein